MKNLLRSLWGRQAFWSIGIYEGKSPEELQPAEGIQNPVLTAQNVTDRKALYVADPFMVYDANVWHMFFEVVDRETQKGEIGHATSKNGLHWNYQKIVLSEGFHLSYPYVFKWQDAFYMIPESHQTKAIRLYKAVAFPHHWECVGDLLTGYDFVDSSVFHYRDSWWLFTCPNKNSDTLSLFYADDLHGPWHEHPASPLIHGDAHTARCGGRVTVWGDRMIRFAQDCYPFYGNKLRAFDIVKLTRTDYQEKESSAFSLNVNDRKKWNKEGHHTIDAHWLGTDKWIACLDGHFYRIRLRKNLLNG